MVTDLGLNFVIALNISDLDKAVLFNKSGSLSWESKNNSWY